jgi:hypothetical protein
MAGIVPSHFHLYGGLTPIVENPVH